MTQKKGAPDLLPPWQYCIFYFSPLLSNSSLFPGNNPPLLQLLPHTHSEASGSCPAMQDTDPGVLVAAKTLTMFCWSKYTLEELRGRESWSRYFLLFPRVVEKEAHVPGKGTGRAQHQVGAFSSSCPFHPRKSSTLSSPLTQNAAFPPSSHFLNSHLGFLLKTCISRVFYPISTPFT